MSKPRPKIEPHRCKTALYLRRKPLPVVAAAAGVSLRHLEYVIQGQRPGSRRVYDAIRHAVGADGWRFAVCETDSLADQGGDHAAH